MLKKIWKDPVGASVISGVILFLLPPIYSLVNGKPVKDSALFLWNLDIKLGPTVIVFFLFLIIVLIVRKFITNPVNSIEELTKSFCKKWTKITDEENKVTFRFNTFISSMSGYPFITDLRLYCINHKTESLISNTNGCNKKGCINFQNRYDKGGITQEIETLLLTEWEKIKSNANL